MALPRLATPAEGIQTKKAQTLLAIALNSFRVVYNCMLKDRSFDPCIF